MPGVNVSGEKIARALPLWVGVLRLRWDIRIHSSLHDQDILVSIEALAPQVFCGARQDGDITARAIDPLLSSIKSLSDIHIEVNAFHVFGGHHRSQFRDN